MRLRALRIKNFLSIGASEVQLDGLTSLNNIVGANNSGKTNTFRALEFVGRALQENTSGSWSSFYHNQEIENPYQLELSIGLSNDEQSALVDSLICSVVMNQVNSYPSLVQGTVNPPQPFVNEMKNFALDKLGEQAFNPLYKSELTIIVRGTSSEYDGPRMLLRSHSDSGEDLYFHWWGLLMTTAEIPRSSYASVDLAQAIPDDLIRKHAEFGEYVNGRGSPQPPPIPVGYSGPNIFQLMHAGSALPAWGSNISRWSVGQIAQNYRDYAPLHRLRAFFRSQDLPFNDKTMIGVPDVFGAIYLSAIVSVSEGRSLTSSALLEDAELMRYPFHTLSAGSLPGVLFQLKNSDFVGERKKYESIQQIFELLASGLSFDVMVKSSEQKGRDEQRLVAVPLNSNQINPFEGSNLNFALGFRIDQSQTTAHKLQIEIRSDKIAVPIESSAGGVAEALLLATAIGGKRNCVILLDEPGQKMHPTLQARLLDVIHDSISKSDNQFLVITHSPYLIKVDDIDCTWRFTRQAGSSTILNIGLTINAFQTEDQKKLKKSLRNADIRSILFSRGVVLVEGISDKMVIERVDQFLATSDESCDLASKEWSVIEVGGKSTFSTFLRLCKALMLPYAIVGDYDALMQLERRVSQASCQTSAIPLGLLLADYLTKDEEEQLKGFEVRTQRFEDDLWYSPELLGVLQTMAEKHSTFIFTKDLEGALRRGSTNKEKKPLKALESVLEQINSGKVSDEFVQLGAFLKNEVS